MIRRFGLFYLVCLGVLVACSVPETADPVRLSGPVAEFADAAPARAPADIPEVAATLLALEEIIEAGSLRRLAYFADRQANFASNFAGERHFEHWYVLRRTGVVPLEQLSRLFDQPHGSVEVGDEVWYVWPDLATRSNADLQAERLSFHDRARLEQLVGQEGLARLAAGALYPGFRTAISNKGRWVYFLQDISDEGVGE